MSKRKHLIIDGNAILYKYFFGYKKEKIEDIIAISHVNMLYKMQYMAYKYKTTNIAIVFDCENKSWRKVYTSKLNTEKVTHREYKAGRREGLSTSELKKLRAFDDSIKDFVSFFRTQTTIPCMQGSYLEGDDLIAGYINYFPEDDHVIYSSDKDFMQLINSIDGTVTLVESQKDTERSLDSWNNDPQLFLFEKCFRGEPRGGDNIQNAYPRLLRTKILAAYKNTFVFNNLMNHKFEVSDSDHNGEPAVYKYETKDLFKENKLLMGLNNQPENIKMLINSTIKESFKNTSKFDFMAFLRFCKNHGMDSAINEKDKFIQILSKRYDTSESASS